MFEDDEKYDVAIVGAGVIGLATAYHLINKGTNVIIFEQFPVPHNRGSSHGHTRIIRAAYKDFFYTKMMIDAYRMWHELEQESGYTLLLDNGLLTFALKGTTVLSEIEHNMTEIGASYELLSQPEISERFPMFKKKMNYDALLDRCGGIILADKCIRALLQSILRKGAIIRDQVEVLSMETRFMDSVVITTSSGVYQARKVIITAGAWSRDILNSLNCQIALTPVKTTVCYWRETQPGMHKFETMPAFIDTSRKVYGIPSYEYPGLMKICRHGGNVTVPNARDLTDDSESLEIVKDFIKTNMHKIDANKPCIAESCMYTMTPDTHFVIDKHPRWNHVIIGTGMSGHGFKLSIVVGKLLSNMALDEEPIHDISPFRIDRFSISKSAL